jgi:hypothetical protein
MRDVYSRASRVVAWLGESTTNDEAIFELISNPMKSWDDQILLIATSFLSRSYFTRVWIVQEVLLAQVLEVWCGEHRADGDILSANLLRFIAPSHSFDDQATQLTPTARAWESSGRKLLSYRRSWQKARSRSFRLRALVESFGALQSSERLDKIYALLGIANDINDGPNPIRPDYDKPPVEVLVDVLRNQHGKKGPRDAEDHEFIEIVRRMLGASRKGVAEYVASRFGGVQQHLFVLMAGLSPRLSLRFIDTVDRWSHTSRLTSDPAHSKRGGRQWHSLDHRPHFDSVLAHSTVTLMDCLVDETNGGHSAGTDGEYSFHDADILDVVSRSIMDGAERCSSAIQTRLASSSGCAETYGTFVGTNGISGTAFGPSWIVRSGMSIVVLADAIQPQVAFVLQPSAPNCWSISAIAYLDKPSSPLRVKSMSSRALRHVLNEVYDSARRKLTQHPKPSGDKSSAVSVCLQYCDTIDLLDLCRCGVLGQEQLKGLLGQALEDEPLDEPHRCGEGCSTLRVGTTWTN